jgi:DNA-binding NtrC family response regulator
MDALMSYDWPGNVRELENTIQQMVAMNSGPLLHLYDLPSQLHNHLAADQVLYREAVAAVGPTSPGPAPMSYVPAAHPVIPLPELEKRAILDALRYTKGDRSLAATLLGIGRTTLYRKLKEYRVEEATENDVPSSPQVA